MTKAEQIKFVRALSNSVKEDVIDQIVDDKIPKDWGGHELRALLSDRHNRSAAMSTVRACPKSRAARDYRNTVLINDL